MNNLPLLYPKFLSTFLILLIVINGDLIAQNKTTLKEYHNYEWAYKLKEATQQVPALRNITAIENNRVEKNSTILNNFTSPWGLPKTLLEPIKNGNTPSNTPAPKSVSKKQTQNQGSTSPTSVYVNISQNNAAEDETIDLKKETKKSLLERLYSGQFNRKASRKLTQFGYVVFEQNTITDLTNGPTPASYILGAGDQIILTLSGSVEAFHSLTIDKEGSLSIPDFGTINLAGTSYGELKETLLGFLQKRRHNFELKVSLAGLRTIQINIVGHVNKPGRITIPALSNPLIALTAAGGVEKEGTLRKIMLSRTNSDGSNTQKTIDLYDYLRDIKNTHRYTQLQEGDTLYVPAIGPTVGIAGYVQKPGIYEIDTRHVSVADALKMSGGLTPFSFTPLAHIERTIDGRSRKRCDIQLSPEGIKEPMHDGELLMIEAVDGQRQSIVRIEGEVARPGDFEYSTGMTLSQLIERADGLTIDAYLKQAFISRQIGKSTSVETIPGRGSHSQSRRILVAQLDKALLKDPAHDFILMPLDLITIRSNETAIVKPVVEIIGSVQRPGTYELTAAMKVSELIAIAGNLTPEVYYDEAELIRRYFDNEALQLNVKRYRFNLQKALAPENHNNDSLNPILSNADKLIIRSLQKAQVRVNIDGRVRFPGQYIFPAGAKITDVITAAGGVLEDADLRASIFTRESTKRLQQTRLDNLIERTRRLAENALEKMVQTGHSREGVAAKIALEQTKDMLYRMKQKEAKGRIVVPFATENFPETAYNLALQNGDSLTIPRRHSTVSISGDVFRPITFIVLDRISVAKALKKAGGLTEMADKDLIYVIRADGEIERAKSKGFMKKKTFLYPGDILLAPTQPMERTMLAKFSDIAILARQLTEIAVITTHGNDDFDVSLVSPFTPNTSGTNAAVLIDD